MAYSRGWALSALSYRQIDEFVNDRCDDEYDRIGNDERKEPHLKPGKNKAINPAQVHKTDDQRHHTRHQRRHVKREDECSVFFINQFNFS